MTDRTHTEEDVEFAVLAKEEETDSMAGHEILLAEVTDPAEVKLIVELTTQGQTNLLYAEDGTGGTAGPIGVIVPWDDYLTMLTRADPDRAATLKATLSDAQAAQEATDNEQ